MYVYFTSICVILVCTPWGLQGRWPSAHWVHSLKIKMLLLLLLLLLLLFVYGDRVTGLAPTQQTQWVKPMLLESWVCCRATEGACDGELRVLESWVCSRATEGWVWWGYRELGVTGGCWELGVMESYWELGVMESYRELGVMESYWELGVIGRYWRLRVVES